MTKTMKKATYTEFSKTTEGRKEVHAIMLSEVKDRMEKMVSNLPVQFQAKAKEMFAKAYEKISVMGNSNIFGFFAEDEINDGNFLTYCDDAIKGKIN